MAASTYTAAPHRLTVQISTTSVDANELLGKHVRHRTSRYLNNRLEQDHRGIKDRCRPMLGLKSTVSATRYCRGYDELRNFLRCRSRMREHVPATVRRWRHMWKTAIVLAVLATA